MNYKVALFAVAPMLVVLQATAQSVNSSLPRTDVSGGEVVESSQNYTKPGSVYQTAPGTVSQPTQVVNVQAAGPTSAVAASSPVTVVEDSPLRDSKAEVIRRQRMDVETQTEQKIVEKLESERIRAERERSDKLSEALDGIGGQTNYRSQPQVIYAKEPVQTVVNTEVQDTDVNVVKKNAVVVGESKSSDLGRKKQRFGVTAVGGIGDYPSLSNVKGIYSAGVTAGMIFEDPFVIEAGIIFSGFDVQPVNPYYPPSALAPYPVIKSMDQTNYFGGLRYFFLDGVVRPNVGGLVSYTRRVYKDRQYYYPGPEITSNAFDAGLSSGLDFALSENFGLGLDMRYLFNLSYRVNGAPQASLVNPQQFNRPVEEYSYYMVTFAARFTF